MAGAWPAPLVEMLVRSRHYITRDHILLRASSVTKSPPNEYRTSSQQQNGWVFNNKQSKDVNGWRLPWIRFNIPWTNTLRDALDFDGWWRVFPLSVIIMTRITSEQKTKLWKFFDDNGFKRGTRFPKENGNKKLDEFLKEISLDKLGTDYRKKASRQLFNWKKARFEYAGSTFNFTEEQAYALVCSHMQGVNYNIFVRGIIDRMLKNNEDGTPTPNRNHIDQGNSLKHVSWLGQGFWHARFSPWSSVQMSSSLSSTISHIKNVLSLSPFLLLSPPSQS